MKNFNLFSNKHFRFAAVLCLTIVLATSNAWGATTIYSNSGATGTSSGIKASGNINANNGNPKPSFANTSKSNRTFITLTGLDVSGYTDVSLTFDYKVAKSGSNYSSFTVSQYNSSNQLIGTVTTVTGTNNTTFNSITISVASNCVEIVFYGSPASSTYGNYVDNISITGIAGSTKTLSSIDLTTQPTTTKYLVGDTFSKTGAVVTATYDDSSTADVSSSATWTPTTGLTSGSNTITASYTEGGVTKTATTTVTAYTVTVNKVDEDGTAIADAGVTASCTGRTLSQNVGSTNYVFKEWQLTTASGTSISTNSITGTPTGNVVVNAVFYKPITITYKANGSTVTTQTYARGGTLAFPASGPNGDTYSCTGKTFVGWVGEANKNYSHATTAPTYATAGGPVTTAETYYAVFADATPSTDYKQITAKGDLVAGAKYLIVGYNSSVYKALPVDAATSLTTVTVSSSTISNPGSTLIWTLEGSADAWKIKSTNNNKYLQISSGSLTFENSTSLTFSVGVSSSVFTFTSSAASGNKVLSYYASQNKFNAYTKANTVYVFKQKITYSNYEVNCCNTPTLTFAASPYAVLREDLGGASTTTWAEVDVTFTSNSTGTISAAQYSNATVTNGTAYQLAASKWQEYETTGGTLCGATHAYFEVLTQPSGETPGTGKFHVKTSSGQTGQGTYRIAITQEGTDESHGNYCETTVYGFVDVTLRDKFVDNVNGNGTVTRDGHGAQLATPTLSEFGTQEEDACHSERRKLKGWIKETDLKAQYETGSSTRVQTVDGLCETCADGTDQTSLIVAPGTNVTMSGATWYAVWAYER